MVVNCTWATITGQSGIIMEETTLLKRITATPSIFAGKPIVRGRRLAVEHILEMLAAGDGPETILAGYPWLEFADIKAWLVYAGRIIGRERVEPFAIGSET
jgi:uncharacterized protein (DUF433 family)